METITLETDAVQVELLKTDMFETVVIIGELTFDTKFEEMDLILVIMIETMEILLAVMDAIQHERLSWDILVVEEVIMLQINEQKFVEMV